MAIAHDIQRTRPLFTWILVLAATTWCATSFAAPGCPEKGPSRTLTVDRYSVTYIPQGTLAGVFTNTAGSPGTITLCRYTAPIYTSTIAGGSATPGGTLTYYLRFNDPHVTADPRKSVVRLYDDDNRFLCSGQAIAPDWVLTAKHCVDDNFSVRVGRVTGGVIHRMAFADGSVVAQIHMHSSRDVALLKLESPLVLMHYGTPGTASFGSSKVSGTFMGWACDDPLNCPDGRETLNVRAVQVWDGTLCARVAIGGICSSGKIIQGDSGGPLIVNNATVGVASHQISSYTHAHIKEVYNWLWNTSGQAWATYARP